MRPAGIRGSYINSFSLFFCLIPLSCYIHSYGTRGDNQKVWLPTPPPDSLFSLRPETRMWCWVNGLQCSGCHKEAFLCLPALLSPSLALSLLIYLTLLLSCSQIRLRSSHAIGQRAVNRSCTLIQLAITFIQAHAPLLSPSLHFFLSLACWNLPPPKKRGWKILWEWLCVWRMDRWVCPLLIVSLTHRPFM